MTKSQLKNKIKEIIKEDLTIANKPKGWTGVELTAGFMSDDEIAKALQSYPDSPDLQRHIALKDFWKDAKDSPSVMSGHLAKVGKGVSHSDDIMTKYGLYPGTVYDQGDFSSVEEDLEEMNSTASVGGEYMTPMAFNPKQKKKKIKEGKDKYKKLWKHKKTIKALYDRGWAPEDIADKLNIPDRYLKDVLRMGEQKEKIKESLDTQDVQQVRKIVKEIINNMFRDIWLKRNSWNRI